MHSSGGRPVQDRSARAAILDDPWEPGSEQKKHSPSLVTLAWCHDGRGLPYDGSALGLPSPPDRLIMPPDWRQVDGFLVACRADPAKGGVTTSQVVPRLDLDERGRPQPGDSGQDRYSMVLGL